MHLQRFFTDDQHRRLAFAFVLLVLLVLLNGFLSYDGTRSLVSDERDISHTQNILADLQGAQTTLDDAETGQRGYIITGELSYLQPYTTAHAAINGQLNTLKALTQDNPLQQARLVTLDHLIQTKFTEMQATIDLENQHQTDQAIAQVRTNDGKHTMDEIRHKIGEMQTTENTLLADRTAKANSNLIETVLTTLIATLLSVGLLILIYFLVSHEIARRELAVIYQQDLLKREQAARAEAEEAVIVRDQFLSLAAHELKTPLTALLANEQMLQRRIAREGGLSERNQRSLNLLSTQALRLKDLIDLMLDVSHIERGQLVIDKTVLDVNDLVGRAVAETQLTTERHTITFTAAPEPLPVRGDALRLEQMLQNLLQNAIKYSPRGGTVTVGCAHVDQMAVITVCDEGIGIPAAAQLKLFDRFYRADNADPLHISGMGIGLYVVQEIVAQHGGTIAVTSAEGVGSTFTVRIPLTHDPLPATQQPAALPLPTHQVEAN